MAKQRPKAANRAIQALLTPSTTTTFDRDVKRMRKRGKDMSQFRDVIEALCAGPPLPQELKDHPLQGNWKDWRDCHVAPDWIIIYKVVGTALILARTGTHSDLFGK